MVLKRVSGSVGGRQHLDIELLEQRARAEFRLFELGGDVIVDRLRRFARQFFGDSEHMIKRIIEPDAGGCAPEQVKIFGERLPDFTMILLYRAAIDAGHAKGFQSHALRVEHAKDVVVRDGEQFRWRAELVVRVAEQARINVAMRTDQRQIFDLIVQVYGDFAVSRVEVAVFRQVNFGHASSSLCSLQTYQDNDTAYCVTFLVMARQLVRYHVDSGQLGRMVLN